MWSKWQNFVFSSTWFVKKLQSKNLISTILMIWAVLVSNQSQESLKKSCTHNISRTISEKPWSVGSANRTIRLTKWPFSTSIWMTSVNFTYRNNLMLNWMNSKIRFLKCALMKIVNDYIIICINGCLRAI